MGTLRSGPIRSDFETVREGFRVSVDEFPADFRFEFVGGCGVRTRIRRLLSRPHSRPLGRAAPHPKSQPV